MDWYRTGCKKGCESCCIRVKDHETTVWMQPLMPVCEGGGVGAGDACEQIARRLWTEHDQNAGGWARRGCDMNHAGSCALFAEISPDLVCRDKGPNAGPACLRAGQAALERQRMQEAAMRFKAGCELKVAAACRARAKLWQEGVLDDPDISGKWAQGIAATLYESTCRLGDTESCPLGVAAHREACSRGHGESCTRVARMYEQGEHLPVNLKEAASYYRIGCMHGDKPGCEAAARVEPPAPLPPPRDPVPSPAPTAAPASKPPEPCAGMTVSANVITEFSTTQIVCPPNLPWATCTEYERRDRVRRWKVKGLISNSAGRRVQVDVGWDGGVEKNFSTWPGFTELELGSGSCTDPCIEPSNRVALTRCE